MLADGLSQAVEWLQVSSGIQDSIQYFGQPEIRGFILFPKVLVWKEARLLQDHHFSHYTLGTCRKFDKSKKNIESNIFLVII